jgi:TrmH family RNA methyltransferase
MLSSTSNNYIKRVKKLHKKKYREEYKEFIVEGMHLVEEARTAGVLKTVLLEEGRTFDFDDVRYVTNDVMKYLDQTESSQGILGVCSIHTVDYFHGNGVVIDAVQDPGNLGTIIRSADAFNADFIILGDGTCDVYNPKVIRSTQGSLFHLPIIRMNVLDFLDKYNGDVYGTSLENGVPLRKIQVQSPFSFIVGNEGNGVSSEILKRTKKNIYIEMPGHSESLNVAIASSIILYELFGGETEWNSLELEK